MTSIKQNIKSHSMNSTSQNTVSSTKTYYYTVDRHIVIPRDTEFVT